MKVSLKFPYVIARQLTVEEMADIETWSAGAVKGTRLAPEQRIIDIVNPGGEEVTAQVGDWIIRAGSVGGRFFYVVLDDVSFLEIFKEVA